MVGVVEGLAPGAAPFPSGVPGGRERGREGKGGRKEGRERERQRERERDLSFLFLEVLWEGGVVAVGGVVEGRPPTGDPFPPWSTLQLVVLPPACPGTPRGRSG